MWQEELMARVRQVLPIILPNNHHDDDDAFLRIGLGRMVYV